MACVTGVAIASATKPNATVDSVLGDIFDHCDPDIVVKELDRELKNTKKFSDIRDMRVYFDQVYSESVFLLFQRCANGVVTKGVCIFQMVKGNTKDAVIAGVNMGRDTDRVAAVAAGITRYFGRHCLDTAEVDRSAGKSDTSEPPHQFQTYHD